MELLHYKFFYQISFWNVYILSLCYEVYKAFNDFEVNLEVNLLTSISGGFMRNPIVTCNLNILPILKSEASNTDHWMPLTPLMLDLTP